MGHSLWKSLLLVIFLGLRHGPGRLPVRPGSGRNPADTTWQMGKQVFFTTCNTCHKDSSTLLAPGFTVLTTMTPRSILYSLDKGKMSQIAASLTEEQRREVAQWVTQTPLKETSMPDSAWTSFPGTLTTKPSDYSGWGGDLEGTGFRTTIQSGLTAAKLPLLKLKWVFAFPDATTVRSKPAVVGNWIIVGGQYGELFALDKRTGKIGWKFEARAGIRGAIGIKKKGNSITAYFTDYSSYVYAVDVRTGKEIWSKRAGFDQQSAVTGSVALYNGKVYVPISSLEVATAFKGDYDCCVSSGGVVALDDATGREVWRYRILPQAGKSVKKKNGKFFYGPSGVPVWCSPTVDAKRGLLYIGTGENYSDPATVSSDAIEAINLQTGKLVWNFQGTSGDTYNIACPFFTNCPPKPGPDLDFGMAPILVKRTDGRDILIAGQKSGVVYGLSPASGKLVWRTRIGKGGALGGIHWGMAADDHLIYASNADNILAIDKRDSSLHATPGLYALNILTGKVVWSDPAPSCGGKKDCFQAFSSAPAVTPGIIFAGGLDGHLRAFATKDGRLLWDFDTMQEFANSSDGIAGSGGALDGPSPVMAGGMLFVNSGYGMFGEKPGNVLLAFSVE
jgi:polyvinyl alcohol dehydrogenase (cytochrome)